MLRVSGEKFKGQNHSWRMDSHFNERAPSQQVRRIHLLTARIQ